MARLDRVVEQPRFGRESASVALVTGSSVHGTEHAISLAADWALQRQMKKVWVAFARRFRLVGHQR